MVHGPLGSVNERSAVRSLQVDDVRLTYVVDGSMRIYPDVFFPAIPETYWSEHPGELADDGVVVMSAGGLLVERDGRGVLIDAGYGPVVDDSAFGSINSGAMLDVLATLGREPATIDVLAFTHLHVDHTGWAFHRRDGALSATFPSAEYRVSEAELAPYRAGERPGGSVAEEVVESLLDRSRVLADGEEIAPGITSIVTPGHTAGHTSYVVTTGNGRRIVAFGDAFHTPAQLANPGWPSRPDADPERVPHARERIVAELAEPDTIGFACHFGDQPFGRVVRDGAGAARWEPVPSIVVAPPPR